jgi:hypothetical protein
MKDDIATIEDSAVINLDSNEAIVLFELLSRWADKDQHSPDEKCFQAGAEGGVLLGVLASLEKQLAAPFLPNYDEILQEARTALAHLWDHPTIQGD